MKCPYPLPPDLKYLGLGDGLNKLLGENTKPGDIKFWSSFAGWESVIPIRRWGEATHYAASIDHPIHAKIEAARQREKAEFFMQMYGMGPKRLSDFVQSINFIGMDFANDDGTLHGKAISQLMKEQQPMKHLTDLPPNTPPVPAGHVVLGYGKDLPESWAGSITQFIHLDQNSNEWRSGDHMAKLSTTLYAFPIDSPWINRFFAEKLVPWSKLPPEAKFVAMDEDGAWYSYREAPTIFGTYFGGGATGDTIYLTETLPRYPGKWQDSIIQRPEEQTMSKEYTIHQDGSVSYKGYKITADEAQTLVDWWFEDALTIAGHEVYLDNSSIRVGCQRIDEQLLRDFCREYRAGEWKKPVEKTYRYGDKFEGLMGTYILVFAENRAAMVNIDSGMTFNSFHQVEDRNSIRLSDLSLTSSQFKEI